MGSFVWLGHGLLLKTLKSLEVFWMLQVVMYYSKCVVFSDETPERVLKGVSCMVNSPTWEPPEIWTNTLPTQIPSIRHFGSWGPVRSWGHFHFLGCIVGPKLCVLLYAHGQLVGAVR